MLLNAKSSTPASYQYFILPLLHIELLVLKHTHNAQTRHKLNGPQPPFAWICMRCPYRDYLFMSYHYMQISNREQLSVQPVSIRRTQEYLHHFIPQPTLKKNNGFSKLCIETSQVSITFIHEHEFIIDNNNLNHLITSPAGHYGENDIFRSFILSEII